MISEADIFNAKILVVDDQQSSVRLLERGLRSGGYINVSTETNGYDVCALHEKHNYDLILLDLELPGMDGFEIIEIIKEIESGKDLPVLVVTAHTEHKLRALKVGVKDIINKPFEINEVLARVHNMVEVRLLYKEAKNYTNMLENALLTVGDNRDLEASP